MNYRVRTHPKYQHLTICEEWGDFWKFYEDMGEKPSPKHTLDRIDNSKGYCPENCRWADKRTQQINRGKWHRKTLTYMGETLPVQEWSKRLGINKKTISSRMCRGLSTEEILSTKMIRGNRIDRGYEERPTNKLTDTNTQTTKE